MSRVLGKSEEVSDLPPAVPFSHVLLALLSIIAGAWMALAILPVWLPGLGTSLLGAQPKSYWYLSRASALVAFGLLWLSMALGLGITNKLARLWPGAPTTFELHQYASLLGLAFALFHALVLMGDHYINYDLAQVLVPFASVSYRQVWVGLGQVGLYLLALVGLSFYVRKRIGQRSWRLIHFLSFAVFLLALAHGVASGTDGGTIWASGLYWLSAGSLLFMAVYRVLVRRMGQVKATA